MLLGYQAAATPYRDRIHVTGFQDSGEATARDRTYERILVPQTFHWIQRCQRSIADARETNKVSTPQL